MLDAQGMTRFIPKMKLVTSDGKEPRAWIRKCLKYFEIYNISREQMVSVASLFLVDRVDAWFHNWIKEEAGHTWTNFERDFCARFGKEGLEDVIEKLMRIRQERTIREYQDKFEDIRIRVEWIIFSWGEAYFLS